MDLICVCLFLGFHRLRVTSHVSVKILVKLFSILKVLFINLLLSEVFGSLDKGLVRFHHRQEDREKDYQGRADRNE